MTGLSYRRLAITIMLVVMAGWALTGCGGTNPVKPVKCKSSPLMDDGSHHYSKLADVKIRALEADVPDGFFDVLGTPDFLVVVEVVK